MKIRVLEADFFHADGQSDMAKLTVFFENLRTRLHCLHSNSDQASSVAFLAILIYVNRLLANEATQRSYGYCQQT